MALAIEVYKLLRDTPQQIPNKVAQAECPKCRHRWIAIIPKETKFVECPKCDWWRGEVME